MKRVLLVTCRALQTELVHYESRLSAFDVRAPPVKQALDEEEAIQHLAQADVAIVGDDALTERVFAACPRVKLVVKWGAGMDAIDVAAARRHGVRVVNSPDFLVEAVSEGALAYLLALLRSLATVDRQVRDGGWPKPRASALADLTLGIIGMGRIGNGVARLAAAFGARVIGHDVNPAARLMVDPETPPLSLDEVLRTADVILLACNATPENRHLINETSLSTMKPGAFLVNVARGSLVSTRALVKALETGHLAGAALDVMEEEPPSPTARLLTLPNVLLGTHNVQNTHRAVKLTNDLAVRLVLEES